MNLALNHMDSILFLLMHLAVSYAVGSWFYDKFPKYTGETKFWKWLMVAFSLFIPVYGPIGLVIVYLLLSSRVASINKPGKIRFEEHLQHVEVQTLENRQIPDYNWKDIKEIQPIVEILIGNDRELQKGAIDTLANKGDINAIKLLKDALGYAHPDVRYFIVESLNKISKQYSDSIYAAKSALDEEPGSAENMVKLADCYYDLARSEIEDHSLNHYFYEQAERFFSKASKYTELEDAGKKKYGNTLRYIGRYMEAVNIFNDLDSDRTKDWEDMSDLMELLFQEAKYGKLSEIAQLYRDSGISTPSKLEKSISLWA
ncbi:MAG: HEAT repeat domain-containing protein [Bacteroidetes bacterium]|jgi:polysaccharide biosynthesis protein PelE|nr:HEAT repeat domain-containing protein [Bacteroidota bacterium]